MNNNAVIYARYSSHSQNETTIEKQFEECEKYARDNGLTVIAKYADRAKTGKNFDRLEFQRMMYDADKHSFSTVIVYASNRFGRNELQSKLTIKQLNQKGCVVCSATESFIGSDSPTDKLMSTIVLAMDEFYSDELSVKLRYGMMQAAKKGQALGGAGVFGYKKENKRYVIDPETAPYVKEIFEMYGNQHKTRAEIIRYLNERNVKTILGTTFKDQAVLRILRNEKYIGKYIYNGEYYGDFVPRIIDDDLFYRVQDMLNKNKVAPARTKEPEQAFLLTPKLYCGNCGSLMTGHSGTGKKGKKYYYYICQKQKKHQCTMKRIRKDLIETVVINEVMKLLTEHNIQLITDQVIKLAKQNPANEELRRLRNEEKSLRNKINYLVSSIENGNTSQAITDKLSQREKELEDLLTRISRVKLIDTPLTETEVKQFLTQFRNGDINNINIRKTIFDLLINKVIVEDMEEGYKKITIICNAHNGNGNDVTLFTDLSSSNKLFSGPEGSRTLVFR